ncbi:uncharacterized protein LOC127773837 isoform X2 [Oryza glaberrima]|uniref:uncharacterized protein LOC127773837 isoform X2 n=1 Tax=Oryza glaberrima TaxID=4538 RepID=UPI00224C1FDC|nr:uncharacterized protein LOC127773837 isoform X2 [Oryza glaberrima]
MEHKEFASSGSEGEHNASPSAFLNLNQEHSEGGEEVGTSTGGSGQDSTVSYGRKPRGPSSMPDGHYVVTVLTETGWPHEPSTAVTPYGRACGCIVKDFIPIKYRHWKTNDVTQLDWTVPHNLKEECWRKLKLTFTFPKGQEELAKKGALSKMSTLFRKWRTDLNAKLVQRNRTLDFEKPRYQKLTDYWDEFVNWKTSQEAREVSTLNKANSALNKLPHRLGPSRYAKNIPKWEEKEEQLCQAGIVVEIDGWGTRTKHYAYARKAQLSDSGELVALGPRQQELKEKITEAVSLARQGKYVPVREKDEFTLALGMKEHPGRTRGVGSVP